MVHLGNGKIQFNDWYELSYHLFNLIGLSINSNSYLYDQDTGIELKYKEKSIKATVYPVEIYAGKNDVLFDPANNYNLMSTLFGYFLDKVQTLDDCNFKFNSQYIEDLPDRTKQRIVVKTNIGDFASNFYYNLYLGYIELVFILSNDLAVDLTNFDIPKDDIKRN